LIDTSTVIAGRCPPSFRAVTVDDWAFHRLNEVERLITAAFSRASIESAQNKRINLGARKGEP
jgi:hypothetical protein